MRPQTPKLFIPCACSRSNEATITPPLFFFRPYFQDSSTHVGKQDRARGIGFRLKGKLKMEIPDRGHDDLSLTGRVAGVRFLAK